MIKSYVINDAVVNPFWNRGNSKAKEVRDNHALISEEPFMNIICCARKNSGKTTTCFSLIINNFMTKKTKLVIFSPDIENDKDNSKAIEVIRKKYDNKRDGMDHVVIYNKFSDDKNNYFLMEVDEAKEEFLKESESQYEYPKTIFYFDDLSTEDLRSDELGHFAQNVRHYGSLCLFSSQDWKNFEPKIRNNVDIVLLWGSIPKERLKDIFHELQPGGSLEEFIKIYNYATSGRRSFLFIDVVQKKFRRNLNQEIYIKNF